jgi:hypothetical protein
MDHLREIVDQIELHSVEGIRECFNNVVHPNAEFNHVACAATLVEHRAGVNALAGLDEFGFGGKTRIFHTVNQNSNRSFEMLNFLLQHSADLKHTVVGLTWGKGYGWENTDPCGEPCELRDDGIATTDAPK